MAQLSLYLTDPILQRLRDDAKRSDTSISKYVSTLIENSGSQGSWPDGYWESVYGALSDPSFEVPGELDPSLDGPMPSFD